MTTKLVNLGAAWPWPAANAPGAWYESIEEHYEHAFECLPPIFFPGGFFVSEPAFHDARGVPAYAAWVKINDRYFVRNVLRDGHAAALAQLRETLAGEASAVRP